jgi:Holliday junction resolvasome RuvABC ATP-dependent DNA helicase subunit
MSNTNTTQEEKDHFAHLIGQSKLKAQLRFYLNSFRETQILPTILLVGGRGSGKTEFAVSLARNLRMESLGGRPKPLLTINSSTLKNVRQFVEDIVLKYVNDQTLTLFFDECHALPESVQTALLTILNPNKKNSNLFRYEDSEILFDFKKVSFVFATTDPQKLVGPFKDRCRVLHMDEYEYSDLGRIVRENLDEGLNIPDEVIDHVASVCRGNARNAVLMAKDNIVQYMKGNRVAQLCNKHWESLCDVLGIMPMGLESSEVQVLKALSEFPTGCSLNNLSAKTGFTRQAIMLEFESYLVKKGLMQIKSGGREITIKGKDYLNKFVFNKQGGFSNDI